MNLAFVQNLPPVKVFLTVTDHTFEAASQSDPLKRLRLLQLSDSALPIGGLSHSFGLESMVEDRHLGVPDLFLYLKNLLAENLLLEAVYCRTAHGFASCEDRLRELNSRLSAWRCARESREASLAMGKRFLRFVASLEPSLQNQPAGPGSDMHFSIAFGYTCGVLCFQADETVAAFLHQNLAASLSAAQRLLPLGQMQSSQIAWDLKPIIQETVIRSASLGIESVSAFSHLPELASMRHPFLSTRLFIS